MVTLKCVNGHDRCYLGPDPNCPYCERVSKYAAKAPTRYRYTSAGCDHRSTYIDKYRVPNNNGVGVTHYAVKRCSKCDIILGEPWLDTKRREDW